MDDEKITFYPGQIIKSFKREFVSVQEQSQNMHLYEVISIAKNTDTGEDMLVYKALFRPFDVFCSPISICTAPIKNDEFIMINQKHCFEPWNKEEENNG